MERVQSLRTVSDPCMATTRRTQHNCHTWRRLSSKEYHTGQRHTRMHENDPMVLTTAWFHMQARLVDKTLILFDSGACAKCCPEWFAPEYPVLPWTLLLVLLVPVLAAAALRHYLLVAYSYFQPRCTEDLTGMASRLSQLCNRNYRDTCTFAPDLPPEIFVGSQHIRP